MLDSNPKDAVVIEIAEFASPVQRMRSSDFDHFGQCNAIRDDRLQASAVKSEDAFIPRMSFECTSDQSTCND